MNVNLIVAVDKHTFGIGSNGSIPWKNKNDMKWFKKVTTGSGNNAVVMGRTTYESIGKPLPNRFNIVLTHSDIDIPGCVVAKSLEDAITIAKDEKVDSLFVIGGSSVYDEALNKNLIDILYIDMVETGIPSEYFDRFFNHVELINNNFALTPMLTNEYASIENTDIKVFYKMNTQNTVDMQYISLMNKIIKEGKTKYTRAGETLSIFGQMMSFDLRNGLPILTTKKVYSKGCIYELLWILHGDTNIKFLIENNTHIWDDDAYRYYLQTFEKDLKEHMSKDEFIEHVKAQDTIHYPDEKGFHKQYTYGDLGPVYGKQWVNWNGINQVAELIDKLKNNPDDRRLMISAWNVGEIKDMALPPCHYLSQWYTTRLTHEERLEIYAKKFNTSEDISDKDLDDANIPVYYLSCMWSQRSVDTCLGLPYDLLSYSILTHLVAQVCNMIPYEIKCSLGDTHIYKNQLDGAIKQIQRNPLKYEYATLELNPDIKDINDFKYDDIKIKNYQSYSTIKYPLSVGL